ncbi:hypothetical protein BTS2_0025 [Bacillus sp. TS-2]|nr:hypothetical protein BTS2_0025 [Bacillus sp. TS-2]
MERERLVIMIEMAVMAALSVILGLVKVNFFWAFGGSISLEMVPIILIAIRRGWKVGLGAGLIAALIDLITGGTYQVPLQVIMDYILPATLLGLAGVFITKGQLPKISSVIYGIILASSLRLLSYFISGVVWFGIYAPEGWNVALYSFVYNISHVFPEMLLTMAIMVLLIKKAPQVFKVRRL